MRILVSAILVLVFLTPCLLSADDTYDFLFIHHSVGDNWLKSGHGNLRTSLEDPTLNDYDFVVHDADRSDVIGIDTNISDWFPKFRDMFDLIRTFDYSPNTYYVDPQQYNKIVMFKSCYIAADIVGEGDPPGDPEGKTKTIWNYKAAYNALGSIFAQNPDTLFIVSTFPPRNKGNYWTVESGHNSRIVTDWLKTDWISLYREITGMRNVAVFDLFDVLANPDDHPYWPNALRDQYATGTNSHPVPAGTQAATDLFIPFINAAMSEWKQIQADKYEFSLSQSDQIALEIDAGVENPGRIYHVLTSNNGTSPGVDLGGGVHLPLNVGFYFQLSLYNYNTTYLVNTRGTLDSSGKASASFISPVNMDPGLVGSYFHFAYLLLFPTDFASGAIPIYCAP